MRSEFVVAVLGQVRRATETINNNIPTGEIEVVADELTLLNDCKPLPFPPSDTALANEEVRLKYRYLDLRREPRCSTTSSCATRSRSPSASI